MRAHPDWPRQFTMREWLDLIGFWLAMYDRMRSLQTPAVECWLASMTISMEANDG